MINSTTLKSLLENRIGTIATLFEFGFDSGTVYYTDNPTDIVYNGNTYEAFGSVAANGPSEINLTLDPEEYKVTLSSVDDSVLGLFLNANYINRTAKVSMVVLDNKDRILWYPWNDSSELLDFDITNNVNLTVSDGELIFDATGSDPQIQNNGLSFNGGVYDKVSVKWKYIDGTLNSVLFFTNTSGGYSSLRAIDFGITNNDPEVTTTGPDANGFYKSIIDMSSRTDWTGSEGNVTGVRFDFGFDSTSYYIIDSIEVFSESPSTIQGDPIVLFNGYMDGIELQEGVNPSATIVVRDKLSDWSRTLSERYNNADQLAKYPGDYTFEFVAQYGDKEIQWPADVKNRTESGVVGTDPVENSKNVRVK